MHTTSSTGNIGFLIQHLAATLVQQNDQMLQEQLGIGFSQFKLLMVLQRKPHIQQKQIADILGQTEASISRQVKLLHDKDLLQTTVSPQNRREHITTLTPKGLRYTEEAVRILNYFHRPMFEQLSEKQQQQLTEGLMIMHGNICPANTNSACREFLKNS